MIIKPILTLLALTALLRGHATAEEASNKSHTWDNNPKGVQVKVERMFLAKVFHHAPRRAECERADAERGDRPQESIGGSRRHCEAGAEGHIGREAHGALRKQCERCAGQQPAGSLPGAAQPCAPLMHTVTSWLPLTAAMRAHAFASFGWQPHFAPVS